MSNYSFDIKNSKDFFKKLEEDYKEFLSNELSSRIALNCAMTAWHLSDWVYEEYMEIMAAKFKTKENFLNDLKSKCPSLEIMQDLTNGTKHYKITRYTPRVKNTDKYNGTFDYTFDFTFDKSRLNIELQNGEKTEFSKELKSCVDFYKSYMQEL